MAWNPIRGHYDDRPPLPTWKLIMFIALLVALNFVFTPY